MHELNLILLILHFLGLAMGLSVPLANLVAMRVSAASPPELRPAFARFPPAMSRVGDVGLSLLWITGVSLAFTRWGGFAQMPWQFGVKFAFVVLLTLIVGYMHVLMAKAKRGDQAAAAKLPKIGRFAFACALIVVVFAVLAFE